MFGLYGGWWLGSAHKENKQTQMMVTVTIKVNLQRKLWRICGREENVELTPFSYIQEVTFLNSSL